MGKPREHLHHTAWEGNVFSLRGNILHMYGKAVAEVVNGSCIDDQSEEGPKAFMDWIKSIDNSWRAKDEPDKGNCEASL